MRHKTVFASILLFTISFVSLAQGGNPPPPMPPPPPGLPVDGSICTIILVVAGLYYGSKKIIKLEKK